MKQIPNDLYHKIEMLDNDVKEKLRKQGIVVPVRSNNGSVRIGRYSIEKLKTGFYSVTNYRGEMVVENINLPQTAALVANRLALGKPFDDEIVMVDRRYGHAEFDELVHNQLADKNIKLKDYDKAEVMLAKSAVAKYRKDEFKKTITKGFEKLLKFR